ncbi:P-loop containing nucleoside triphosphate hydrolase protein, partial [Meredithblackwellia eburnea MCA 4105]
FATGSIVRITLHNFLTYDQCVFYPGPHLNVILGPNGVGKSSVSAAIALGLGFSPKVIGRQTDLKNFVQDNKDEGYIEIELMGKPGSGNQTIRRTITAAAADNSSKFLHDAATQEFVKIQVAKLNIRLDNLCTFLPQDRVAQFAQLTPAQWLTDTQSSAGHHSLTDWHNKLIEKYKKKLVHESVSPSRIVTFAFDFSALSDVGRR